ncbi:hypothetical protein AAG570_010258 [Ranatra chinensis]|uniref:Uncharacterized protein n=1 Tax=Ranatra chinensis TaxID=642074 RepID=A0ABD0YM12_9HEMI
MLVQREALAEGAGHQVVRKSNNRSPQVRLRFGRRSDPYMYQVHNMQYIYVHLRTAYRNFKGLGGGETVIIIYKTQKLKMNSRDTSRGQRLFSQCCGFKGWLEEDREHPRGLVGVSS